MIYYLQHYSTYIAMKPARHRSVAKIKVELTFFFCGWIGYIRYIHLARRSRNGAMQDVREELWRRLEGTVVN